MDDVEQFQRDVRAGRIGSDRLVDLIVTLQRQLQAAQRRIAELEKKLGGAATTKVEQPFSLRAEEQRQEARGKKPRKRNRPLRRGRIATAEKLKLAERTERVYPLGIAESECQWSHTRPVWRLENGRAVLVAYEVYRGPRSQFGQIPGVVGRGEFGIEILVAIAYQVYIVGLSFDKVCLLLNFFQNLRLRKSQADALLSRLLRHWEGEFERLCALLANSAVVHTDETSWSLNSVWAFLSEQVRVLFFGVHKDAETLHRILDPATFAGIVISDDLMRLMLARELFTFVTAPPVTMPNGKATPVAGTNNEAERTLRSAATARKTGRTSKTLRGARRQTILVSVLESLRQQLPTFTLSSVIGEILAGPTRA